MRKAFDRDKILNEAVLLAKEVGLNKLSMRALASRLDCSVMPIYDSFDSKETLVEEIYNAIIRENNRADNYLDRNKEVLMNGLHSPQLYRDMREYGAKSFEFMNLYDEVMQLMKAEECFKGFDLKVLESIHFDLLIYITGLVERKMDQSQEIPDFESFCVTLLDQFTQVLILGYRQALTLENGK